MQILAIDTTSPFFSFSHKSPEKSAYHYLDDKQWQHAERLLEKLSEVISDFTKLDYLVISRGPGGFTGLRIGLAIAKAFKIAVPGVKIITPSQFQVIAYQCLKQDPLHEVNVLIDAKRGEVVRQVVNEDLQEIGEMENITTASLKELISDQKQIFATDSAAIAEIFKQASIIDYCTSRELLECAEVLLATNYQANFNPIYFRPSDAKLPVSKPHDSNSNNMPSN